MKISLDLEELQNLSLPLKLNHIHLWLLKHEEEFYKAIELTSCKKWDKWLERCDRPLPCCCPTRESECIFIEFYYDLDKIIKGEYNLEFISLDIIEYVLVTQNDPYKKIKFLIELKH